MRNIILGTVAGFVFWATLAFIASYIARDTQVICLRSFSQFDQNEECGSFPNITIKNKIYAPCQEILGYTHIDSNFEGEVSQSLQLYYIDGYKDHYTTILINENESTKEMKKQNGNITFNFQLPCNLDTGRFFFKGTYTFRISGYNHSYAFRTEDFSVKAN